MTRRRSALLPSCVRGRAAAIISLVLMGPALALPASAATFKSRFDISIAGYVIGEADVTAEVSDTAYSLSGEARAKGFSRIVTDARGTAEADGRIADTRVVPASYGYRYQEGDDDERLSMTIRGGAVSGLTVVPEPEDKEPEPDRIVLEPKHKRDIIDPVSALVWQAKAPVDGSVCNRTVPIFDGEQRYDIALSYKRRDRFDGGDEAYQGPVIVCRIDYRPIAGHRTGKREIQELKKTTGMEVWLAPLPGPEGRTVFLVPVRTIIPTRFGTLEVAMDRLSIDP
ncbi:DUF3108 domain-containing protein [Amorphus orientalis]|uniref:DUF3108 domain-containing protein n=1 Tax=Amorphus orientalis TaxID=649198 RepID=A0AAE4AT96_9HYPH|nr:DUF3108 domain-containing protein [Amorphus orientalis]MDQ0317066.1 hypothetical protein [Amorphus orientalis]